MSVYCILQSFSKRTSRLERSYHLGYLDIFLPGPGQLPSPFSLAYASSCPIPTLHFCVYIWLFSPLSFFLYLPIAFWPFLYCWGTSLPIPLHFSLVLRYYIPPPFQYYSLFHCSSLLICFLFVSCPSLHIIIFLLSPHCAHGNFDHGVVLDYDFYLPPIVLFCIFRFVIMYWTDFLLICSLFCPSNFLVPVLYSTVGFWCLLVPHVVFLLQVSLGYYLPPSYCFALDLSIY